MSRRDRKREREKAQQVENSRGGSQTPPAREGEKKIFEDLGAEHQELSADIHARVCARAREVDPSDHWARVEFCKTIKNDFERGVTSAVLADVWGLATSTVQRDMSIAWAEIRREGNDTDRAIWWHGMHELLEAARRDGELVEECIANVRKENDGKFIVDAMGLKMVSDALGRSRDSVVKVLEQIGKASGLLQSGSSHQLTVNLFGEKRRVPTNQAQEALEVLFEELQSADPAVFARVMSRLADRGLMDATTVTIDVPALPGGGNS